MAKRPAPRTVPSLRTRGADITETIDHIDGLDPVSITYRAPTPAAMDAMGLATRGADAMGRMDHMLAFAARHLVCWSLPYEVSVESLEMLESSELRFALFNRIFRRGEQLGN